MGEKNIIITDMDLRGRGIGKDNGKVIFINGAVTGDTVSYETSVSKKRYDIGNLTEIISPSPDRQPPPCENFEKCGGCSFMNVSRNLELDIKRRAVESAFRRAGINNITVSGILHGNPTKYRNKAVFHKSEDGKYGFFRSGTNDICPLSSCLIVPDIFNEIIKFTEEYFDNNTSYDIPDSIMLRSGNSGIMVIAEVQCFSSSEVFLTDLCKYFPCIESAYECVGYPTDAYTEFRHVCGSETITINFNQNVFRISPKSFFQINTEIAESFCHEICKRLSPDDGDLILDLYCGIGTIGLSLAKHFPKSEVIGIEINDSAVKDGRTNCEISGIRNARFICSDAGNADYEGLSPYALIVDPPRYGLSDSMIKNIIKISPHILVYMSCDPGTLAGNSSKLIENGYSIIDCIAGDMFPYSPHVETLCFFEKKKV